jgi:tetratricopeptide (TPR) repeat protein
MRAHQLKKQQQKALARNDITTAEQLWSEAQLIAKSSAKKEDTAIAYQMEGALLHAKFDYPRAITVYELAVKIYKSVRNNLALADVLSDLSTVYYSRGQYRQVVILLEQVIGLAEPIGHTETVAHAHNQIGLSQSQLGDLGTSGSQLVSIAVELFDQLGQ